MLVERDCTAERPESGSVIRVKSMVSEDIALLAASLSLIVTLTLAVVVDIFNPKSRYGSQVTV